MKKRVFAVLAGVLMLAATNAMATSIYYNVSLLPHAPLTNVTLSGISANANLTAGAHVTENIFAYTNNLLENGSQSTASGFTIDVQGVSGMTFGSNFIFDHPTYSGFDNFFLPSLPVQYSYNLGASGILDITLSAENIRTHTGYFTADFYLHDVPPQSAPVPEPGTMALLGLGMAGLAVYGKRRAKKNEA
ncbi:MAG: PEP-CTERM sorting domain-containing protein [Desulfuromonadales bacterium]